jgi:drug/metabolite transporter (DMT)-like permease
MNRITASGTGTALALLSAATFGTSGTFAASLIDAGWTPGAAVTIRVSLAALILTVPALHQLRGRWLDLRRGAGSVAAFGLVAVAGCQLCYFNAVQRLSVGVALLLEYLGVILVVLWMWLRHSQRPRSLTVIGALAALFGLALVLDITGTRIDVVGVLWGLAAATGLAVYFVMSASEDEPLPPLVMAWAAMTVGAVTLLVLGASGAIAMRSGASQVRFLDHRTSWLVPVVGLSLVAAVIAYVSGIGAARRLGAKLASFVGLTEVVFAVIFAWLLLGQVPTLVQLVGGAFIIGGVTVVRIDGLRDVGHHTATEPAADEVSRSGRPARV